MATLRDRLKTMFTQNVLIKNLPGGRLKAFDVNKTQTIPQYQYTGKSKWRTGRMSGYGPGFGGVASNEEIEAMRRLFYVDYEIMDSDAIISSALDLIAEESTTVDVDGQLLKIKTDNERIKKTLHNLFYDVLNIEFNLWSWIRMMCKYGDHFLYLQIDDKFGVVNVQPIHPSLIRREEGFDENQPDLVQFKYEGEGGYWSTQEKFEAFEIAHFRLLTDTNYLPYGRSFVEPAKKAYKMLSLLEDAVLLHRIMRAPERRIVKIDIGNIAPEEVDAHVEQIVSEMKKTPYIDPVTGDYNLRYNLENAIEDWFLPVRGGQSGNSVEVLPGLQNQNAMDDVEYIRKKMMAALKIPKEFVGYGEDSGGGGSKAGLASLDIRFARTVERVQKIFVSELYKIAIIHLYTQGFREEDLLGFEIYLTNPSLVFERQKTDVMTAKVDLAKSIIEGNLFPLKFIYENVFGHSEDEWKANKDRLVEDAKFQFRLKQIVEEGNDPQVSGKSFGTPWDIASLQVSSKMNPGSQEEIDKLYTPDGRENNEGKPPQYKGNFETKRDQDFGRDPVGRRENDKTEMPSVAKESFDRLIKKLEKRYNKDTKKSLLEKKEENDRLNMLDEGNILDDSTN